MAQPRNGGSTLQSSSQASAPSSRALEQGGDVAAGHGAGGGAVVVHHRARHAQRREDALLAELLQRHARRLIGHVGEDGVALVAVAHVFARRAHGGVGAMGDVVDDLLDGRHGVGGAFAHGARPFALLALAVHGDGPFQRFHGRYAAGVLGQRAQRHRVAGGPGHVEIGEIAVYGVVVADLALRFEDGEGQRGDGFGHGGDAEDGVHIRGDGVSGVAEAVATGKAHALRADGADGDAGETVAGDERRYARVHGGGIKRHTKTFFRTNGAYAPASIVHARRRTCNARGAKFCVKKPPARAGGWEDEKGKSYSPS